VLEVKRRIHDWVLAQVGADCLTAGRVPGSSGGRSLPRASRSTLESAEGIRYGPAMPATMCAASADWRPPAAVTYSGRLAVPRITSTACVAVRKGVFAT